MALDISKKSLILIFGSSINQFFILISGLLSARYLGPSQYGVISLSSALNGFFIFFIEFGFHSYLIRQVAKDNSSVSYYYSNLLTFKIVLFLPLFFFSLIFMTIAGYESLIIQITAIITLSFILNSFVYCFYALIQAHHEMKFIAIGYILNGLISFISFIWIIITKESIYSFAFVPLIVNCILLIYTYGVINLKYSLEFHYSSIIDFFNNHFFKAIPFGITGLFITIYLGSTSFWLSIFHNEALVGFFNASLKIVFAFFVISQGINMTVYPLLSNLFVKNKMEVKEIFLRQLRLMIIVSTTITFCLIVFAKQIVFLFLGEKFDQSILVLQILSFIVPLVFIRSAFERVLEITGNQLKETVSYGVGITLGFFFNIFLVYFFEMSGGALAMVLTDLIIFTIIVYQYEKIKYLLV